MIDPNILDKIHAAAKRIYINCEDIRSLRKAHVTDKSITVDGNALYLSAELIEKLLNEQAERLEKSLYSDMMQLGYAASHSL